MDFNSDFPKEIRRTVRKLGGQSLKVLAVEAKGGNSNLGTRTLTDGTVVQQGSAEYTQAIIDNMTTKYNNLIKSTDYVPGQPLLSKWLLLVILLI